MKRALRVRTPSAWGILLLLCLTTTFCGPHDEEELTEHADGIESPSDLVDSHGVRAVRETPIVPGTTAGYLPGTSEVTPSGEFTYRIDLDVPAGRAGMEPAISLNYASRSENGLLGVGWHLDGFSEIRPCAKTFAQEGTADGIDFDYTDSLCLDGQKLVALRTAAGVTEYRTEQESFSRILAQASGAGPATFIVYKRDGRILEYAPITAKREDRTHVPENSTQEAVVTSVTLAYLLSKERDRAGNEIRYQYEVTREDRSPYAIEYHPSAIDYTFQLNTGASGKRKVVLKYEGRPDPSFAYVSGVKLRTTKRLRAIEMHGPNPVTTEPLWSYALSYETGPAAGRSLLASIKKCGAVGGCLLAKQFHYGNPWEPYFRRASGHGTAEASPDARPHRF